MSKLVENCSPKSFNSVVRVLKKYPFSKHLLFLDVVACKSADPFNSHSQLSVYSVVIKSEDVSTGIDVSDDINVRDIHAGDVLLINGVFQDVSEEKNAQLLEAGIWKKQCVFVRSSDGGTIKRMLEWDCKSLGLFSYCESHFLPFGETELNQVSSSDIKVPTLVLQAKNKASEKALELLRDLYPSHQFRQSAITLSNSKDRLILCFEGSSAPKETLEISNITSNDLLSQAVSRIYPVSFRANPSVVHPDLTIALTLLHEQLNSLGLVDSAIVRVQSYPRHIAPLVVSSLATVHWSPKGFTHVLSVVLVDAVWMISLVPSNELLIGDIYENSNKFGSKSVSALAESAADEKSNGRVCKSINKLHEILRRNDWIYDQLELSSSGESTVTERPHHSYGVCLDVGSSPGGWSTYLARHVKVQRVISVDKGVMNVDACLMPPIEHWQMLGQDAVLRLRDENQRRTEGSKVVIDLYCCDANIAPVLSTALLVQCVEYQLMSEGARFVLTLKNTLGKAKEWVEAKAVCMEMLQKVFSDVKQVSLLANTPKETTVTGVYRKL